MATTTPEITLKASPEATKILNLLRTVPEAVRSEVKAKLDPATPPRFPVSRTAAGGIEDAMPLDQILEANWDLSQAEWAARATSASKKRFNFSKIGTCFLQAWLKEKGVAGDDGLPLDHPDSQFRFAPGNSEPGHATEDHVQYLMEQVYAKGKPGAVQKDIRMSEALQVEGLDEKGEPVVQTIYVSGKSDIVIMGDNLEIIDFMELKSPIMWPRKKTAFIEKYGKAVSLNIAKIEEPAEPNGIVNLNNALQLAIGVHILRKNGIRIKKVTLLYVNRERYAEHVAILLSPAEVRELYDLAVWWITEHYSHLCQDTPPDPHFFMGYECKRCPVTARCKSLGGERKIHPIVPGLNERMAAAQAVPRVQIEEAET